MEGLHQRCGPGYGDEEWWSALSYAEQVEAAAGEGAVLPGDLRGWSGLQVSGYLHGLSGV